MSNGCVKITSVSKGGENVSKDTRSRKWQITINSPIEKGLNHETIKEKIEKFSSVEYWVMSDEIGETGTYHTHLYIALECASKFSTVKKRFDIAHIEMAQGTSQQNRDYIFKEGKWSKDKKKETNLKDTHEENGIMPIERPGTRNDLNDLYDMIKQGMTNYDILEQEPKYMLSVDKIERCRQIIRENNYKNTFRELETLYIHGETGTGKTRSVMEKYGYENCYRITDYKNPFDSYKGQDVIIFEEFRSSIPITDMLNYLDGYPLELPCRYSNKIACYTKIYLISNLKIYQQYINIQEEYQETWQAFLRRIKEIKEYPSRGQEGQISHKDCNLKNECIQGILVEGVNW